MARTPGSKGRPKILIDDLREIHQICSDAGCPEDAIKFAMGNMSPEVVRAIIEERKKIKITE